MLTTLLDTTFFNSLKVLELLEMVNNGEIEDVLDLTNKCSPEIKKIIPAALDYNLIFISSDDRLLLTEYGQLYFLKLHEKKIR